MTLTASAVHSAHQDSGTSLSVAAWTPPAQALLVAFVTGTGDSVELATPGLTWTQQVRAADGSADFAEIWTAPQVAAGSRTVTGAVAGGAEISLDVVAITSSVGRIPVPGDAEGASGAITATVTAARAGAWAWIIGLADAPDMGDVTGQTLQAHIDAADIYYHGNGTAAVYSLDVLGAAGDDLVPTLPAGQSADAVAVIAIEEPVPIPAGPQRDFAYRDGFARSSTSGWGTADSGPDWTMIGSGGTVLTTDWTVDADGGHQLPPAANGFRIAYLPVTATDVDLFATGSVSLDGDTPAGARVEILGLLWRLTDSATYYMARVNINTGGSMDLYVYDPANVEVGHATGVIGGATYTSGDELAVRVRAHGTSIKARAWIAAADEPTTWDLDLTSTESADAGAVGIRCGIGAGNTDTKPVDFTIRQWSMAYYMPPVGDGYALPVGGTWHTEVAPGANTADPPDTWTWTAVTPRKTGALSATVGRGDETSQAPAASLSWTMPDDDGDWTMDNPTSQYWPGVQRGMPARAMVDMGDGPRTISMCFVESLSSTWLARSHGRSKTATLSAKGALSLLGRRTAHLHSSLYMSTVARVATDVVAYWPMEGGAVGGVLASAVAGQAPMSISTGLTFSAPGVLYGSDVLPTLTGTSTLTARIDPGTLTDTWRVDFWAVVPSVPSATVTLLTIDAAGGDVARWIITAGDDTVGGVEYGFVGYDSNGTQAVSNGFFTDVDPGDPAHIQLDVTQDGTHISVTLSAGSVTSSGTGSTSATVTGTVSLPTRVRVVAATELDGIQVGHLAVRNTLASDTFDFDNGAARGWPGETVTARMLRISADAGVRIAILGTSTATCGPQRPNTYVATMRECEATDGGLLHDGTAPGGLRYITRTARYNLDPAITVAAPALDGARGQLAAPFGPADDTQRLRNDIQVSNWDQSTAFFRVTDGLLGTDALGSYPGGRDIVTDSAVLLGHTAGFEGHLGTARGSRYPQMALNPVAVPSLGLQWAAATRDLSYRLDVTQPRVVLPQLRPEDIAVIVEGWTLQVSNTAWTISANCSPYDPWRTGIWGGTDLPSVPRYDSTTSTLADALDDADPGDTDTLTVDVTTTLWTTDTDSWDPDVAGPLHIIVGDAEVMTVTGISGTSSPQTITVSRGTHGLCIAHDAGATVRVWHPAIYTY